MRTTASTTVGLFGMVWPHIDYIFPVRLSIQYCLIFNILTKIVVNQRRIAAEMCMKFIILKNAWCP